MSGLDFYYLLTIALITNVLPAVIAFPLSGRRQRFYSFWGLATRLDIKLITHTLLVYLNRLLCSAASFPSKQAPISFVISYLFVCCDKVKCLCFIIVT